MRGYYKIRAIDRAARVIAVGGLLTVVGLQALGIECPGHPGSVLEHGLERDVDNNRNRDSYDRVESYSRDRDRAHDGRDRPDSRDYERAEQYFRDNGV